MKSNRNKVVRIVCLILCAVMLLSLVSSALIMMANAASSSEILKDLEKLRSERNDIQRREKELLQSIEANQQKTKSLVTQKAELDQQMEIGRQTINNLNAQIQQYNLLIAEKQTELECSLAAEQELLQLYRTRIRSMEETGTISYWSILFQANSFSDLLDRLDMIHEIAESDQLMLEKLAEATEQVKSEREELEAQRVELEQTEQQLADEQTAMEEKRAESDKLILQMASEAAILSGEFEIAEAMEEEIRAQIKKTETEYYNALSREEAARIAEMNKKNNNKVSGNGKGATSTGGFFFPLAWSNGVTSAYGQRVHPIYGYNGFHYGVDLGAGMNTAIYATKSGTVTASTYGEANGYYVTINHGDGYSSLYAHMVSNEVSVGDYVKQGDLIGHVGTSGWSNGPHLHFEILYNGSNVNPMNYISVP